MNTVNSSPSKKDIYVHKHTEICIQFQEVHDPLEAPYMEHLLVETYSAKEKPNPTKTMHTCII